MNPDDPMNRSGAVWCPEHSKWECCKQSKRSGSRCHKPAIKGRAACNNHIGESLEVAKGRGAANMLVWSLLSEEHLEASPLDPAEVVVRSMRVSVMRADFLAARVRALVEQLDGNAGLVGPTYAAGRDGARVETGEAVRALTKLEAEERDRAVRFAKTAHDMGIDTRRLELEQAQASIVVSAVGAALDAVELVGEVRDLFLNTFLAAIGRVEAAGSAGGVVVGVVAG
jgi:hypothetical protein